MTGSVAAPPFVPVGEPASAEVLDFLFRAYLGRPSAPANVAQLLDERKMTVAQIEEMLRKSPEYRSRGRLLQHGFRGASDGAILMIEPARLFFCPIAKVANTSVKDWALRLSGEGVSNAGSVHHHLDSGRSPMQIRHWPMASVAARMQSPGWARVAILRDPEDRLVSCYWDKFVRNRAQPGVLFHTAPVYRFFHGEEPTAEQVERGLSFRQFCHYINHAPRDAMDPHWAPQYRYLENHRWDRLFTMERIAGFEAFVLSRCPPELQHVRLGLANVAPRHAEPVAGDISDHLPCEMAGMAKPPNAALLSPDIRAFIRDYYALDRVLLAQARADQPE
ncbi:Sulfotransferase family protein [Lutimaribacter pacificus]|uniref:Sulfotransferase family protein n=1 Tax=Lutimaribacter pacificus TaxID=391948 RepID=A0A1H0CPS8_9RHOB|nr:sulfotransferase family 2 domain-containing protein [Lutimaribacter pacificus]SDN59880.1 Sulfotransferase family protein [Lutimaribacter pacificus]SHJ42207.1 Sulfotransferase family protein [Lutimaribacter pacificus]